MDAPRLPPTFWCRAVFLGAALGILTLQLPPRRLRAALMAYGARRPRDRRAGPEPGWPAAPASLAGLAEVPHAWFWHYYLLSVSASAFWAWQYLARGSALAALARAQASSPAPSTALARVFLAWSMLAAQGSRRLYECFFVAKPGPTPMLLVHWVLGLVFYAAMSVAVWIEGSGAILESSTTSFRPAVLLTSRVPPILAVFLAASIKQNECHRHLASLRKYTLPSDGWFGYLVCPHYTCECVIYLAVASMAAPPGSVFNTTVLCALAFVAVNLGATAHGTKQWYGQRFGAEHVAARWSMIPFVF